MRNAQFPEHNGEPGTMRWWRGESLLCPDGVTGDAADRSTIYDQYDAAKALEYLDGGRRRKEQWRDPEGRETGTVEEEDDDADDVVEQTQTHTESAVRRDVPDARMRHERDFADRIEQQQAHREKVMSDCYAAYDRKLMEQSRR